MIHSRTDMVRHASLTMDCRRELHKTPCCTRIIRGGPARDVMAPMKFVVKYFSEIATKSKAVRHVSDITYILEVREHPLPALDEIVEHALPICWKRQIWT